tara:strand:+ start:12867 stop:13043 length:177 start_codon:yes stop_codon:yes gene_type:complete
MITREHHRGKIKALRNAGKDEEAVDYWLKNDTGLSWEELAKTGDYTRTAEEREETPPV